MSAWSLRGLCYGKQLAASPLTAQSYASQAEQDVNLDTNNHKRREDEQGPNCMNSSPNI